MRKLLVSAVLVMTLLSFSQWIPPLYGTTPASNVEITGTFKGIGFVGGRFVLILDSEGNEINVLAPLGMIRAMNFKLYTGEEIKVFGNEIVWGDIKLIVPTRFVYKGKEYDLHMYPYSYGMRTKSFSPAFRGYYNGWNWNYHHHRYYHYGQPFRRPPAPFGRRRIPIPGPGYGW